MNKKNQKVQEEKLFFVQVKGPSEVRRSILESLKEILELLQRFEKFKHTRHEKLERIRRLRSLMRDTNKLMAELKSKMPQTSLKGAVAREQKHPKKHAKKEEAMPKPRKSTSEIDRLEAELSAIESKLKSFT